MQIQTFRAESLQEALQLVRDELGPDASVLQTREVKQPRLGVFRKRLVEVEASVEIPVASKFNVGKQQSAATSAAAVSKTVKQEASTRAAPPRRGNISRFSTKRARRVAHVEPGTEKSNTTGQGGRTSAKRQQVDSQSLPPKTSASDEKMTAAAYEVVSELLDHGFPPQLAAQSVKSTVEQLPRDQHNDSWLLRGRLGQNLAKQITTSGPIEASAGGDPKIVALIGPTGVGKTTTLAKIAAGFRFDLGLDVGMITIDTFRLGAVDQLLQYAELISASLEVVSSPEQITGAIQRQRECDVILIDTAGRSPRDTEQLSVLAKFLDAAQPDERHLVLSAAMSQMAAEDALQRFGSTKPTHLMLSKIDESVCFGSWYELLAENSLPISYLTTGQHVPQDISVASGRRLAGLLLGSSQYHSPAPQPQSAT